jgi:ABC-type cobalamin/Fe3+-siderophores transport system ATPase subunit
MITELVLKNFKSIEDQTYKFSDFDLLVGRNNSGKSTILQAMAIWQYCVDEFHRIKRTGKKGVQVVLPNFTALPLPEFNLLWTDKIDRKYPHGKNKPQYVLIEITLRFNKSDGTISEFGVSLRYQSPQSIYAIPKDGWSKFKELDDSNELPRIVYVPPFSGLDPSEKWIDDGVVRQYVGKGQPGSVLRNLLFRVIDKNEPGIEKDRNKKGLVVNPNWNNIQAKIKEWFGVNLLPPEYEMGIGITINSKYEKEKGKEFDILSGGSGFHQALTLLAFYYGYPGLTTILFDEPDAHMHVNLQREILNYFQQLKTTQFIIATHAEEFIKGVAAENIISVLNQKPERVQSSPEITSALSDVDNMAIVRTQQSPYILYVEGEDDERILFAWASVLNREESINKFYIEKLGGGTKNEMKNRSDSHFTGLKKIVPSLKRIILFDYDTESSFHPEPENIALFEWKRKNIENYLLVPEAWHRAVFDRRNEKELNIYNGPIIEEIDNFFVDQNLNLPKGKNWRDIDANIFKVVDGKKILFELKDSLFQRLSNGFGLSINRDSVSRNIRAEDIHSDVVNFFEKITEM